MSDSTLLNSKGEPTTTEYSGFDVKQRIEEDLKSVPERVVDYLEQRMDTNVEIQQTNPREWTLRDDDGEDDFSLVIKPITMVAKPTLEYLATFSTSVGCDVTEKVYEEAWNEHIKQLSKLMLQTFRLHREEERQPDTAVMDGYVFDQS